MSAFDRAWDLLKEEQIERNPEWIARGMSDDIAFDGKADCFEHVRKFILAHISEHAESSDNPRSGDLFDLYANGTRQEVVQWMMNAPSELHTTALGLLCDCEQANLTESSGDSMTDVAPMHFSEYMGGEE
jgi:hypothetical protein